MKKKVADALSSAIELQGIQQKDMAKALYLNTTTLNNYVKGKRDPDVNTLIQMMMYLGIDLNAYFSYKPTNEDFSITHEEAKLLKIFRSASHERQSLMIRVNKEIAKEE